VNNFPFEDKDGQQPATTPEEPSGLTIIPSPRHPYFTQDFV
jgi:hypothetical protein